MLINRHTVGMNHLSYIITEAVKFAVPLIRFAKVVHSDIACSYTQSNNVKCYIFKRLPSSHGITEF